MDKKKITSNIIHYITTLAEVVFEKKPVYEHFLVAGLFPLSSLYVFGGLDTIKI